MDVVLAFLNGDLGEEVYMEQTDIFERGNPDEIVCRLLRSLYGLKQAPRQLYDNIDEFLVNELNMKRNLADECLYIRHQS